MQSIKLIVLLATLMVSSSQGSFSWPDGPVQTFVQDIKPAVNDPKEPVVTEENSVGSKVTALGKYNHHTLKNIKESQVEAVKSIVEKKVATLEAIKAGKVAFLKSLAKRVTAQFHGHVEIDEYGRPVPKVRLPLLSLIAGIFETQDEQDEQSLIKIGGQEYAFVPSIGETLLETLPSAEPVAGGETSFRPAETSLNYAPPTVDVPPFYEAQTFNQMTS